jgi:hypothetical protein
MSKVIFGTFMTLETFFCLRLLNADLFDPIVLIRMRIYDTFFQQHIEAVGLYLYYSSLFYNFFDFVFGMIILNLFSVSI